MMMRSLTVAISIVTLSLMTAAKPGFGAEMTSIEMAAAHSRAPDFVGLGTWYNSGPLSIASLRGKVVLVNFWTYGCVNCVNTLPHIKELYSKYKDQGLVVVGIHTPEFPFEKSASNVQGALRRHGISYPVAQDNESRTWSAYRNRYWPAQYIVDQKGMIVFQHDGEGAYDTIEQTIKKLLGGVG